jgi:hypothetical protein
MDPTKTVDVLSAAFLGANETGQVVPVLVLAGGKGGGEQGCVHTH